MPTDLVIDANVVLYTTGGHDESKLIQCSRIFLEVIDNDEFRMALDNDNEILSEYKTNMETQKTVFSNMFEDIIEKEAYGRGGSDVFRFRFPIDEDKVAALSERGFHSNDLIYVRIAPKTESKAIISTDGESFLREEYKQWMKENLGVDVYMPEECLEEILD